MVVCNPSNINHHCRSGAVGAVFKIATVVSTTTTKRKLLPQLLIPERQTFSHPCPSDNLPIENRLTTTKMFRIPD